MLLRSQLGAGIALIHIPSCRFGFLLQCGQALARASRGGLLSGAGLQVGAEVDFVTNFEWGWHRLQAY